MKTTMPINSSLKFSPLCQSLLIAGNKTPSNIPGRLMTFRYNFRS